MTTKRKDPLLIRLDRERKKLSRLYTKYDDKIDIIKRNIEDINSEIIKENKLDLIRNLFEKKAICKDHGDSFEYMIVNEVCYEDNRVYLDVSDTLCINKYHDGDFCIIYSKGDKKRLLDSTEINKITEIPKDLYLKLMESALMLTKIPSEVS